MAVWGLADLAEALPRARRFFIGLGAAAIAISALSAAAQVRYWENDGTLFSRALRVTANNHVAHLNLGVYLFQQERLREAAEQFEQALLLRPNFPQAYSNLGVILEREGRLAEAVARYEQALGLNPDSAETHFNLAVALQRLGKNAEAESHYRAALDLDPDYNEAQINLRNLLGQRP
jgi:Flp pilus assembly protein TadD